MSRRDKDKPEGFWWEHDHNVPKGWTKGRAGKAPRGKDQEGNPGGWGLGFSRRGPTRGSSTTGHDRRGGWFFGRGK